MTEGEMYIRSFERPKNFFLLPGSEQWDIDKRLGILDWNGGCSHDNEKACQRCTTKFHEYYNVDNTEQK